MSHYQEPNAVQVLVSLDDIDPPVWRQLVVPSSHSLRQLHLIIQSAFGWQDSHLHEFEIGGLRYGNGDIANEDKVEGDAWTFEEIEVALRDFSREPGLLFKYIYDFGDNWVHTVELEKHIALAELPKTAKCVAGGGACPPEDVGGVSGYQHFLEALADPGNPDHNDIRQWYGGPFDPDWFDLELTNTDLIAAFRPSRPRRMRQPKRRTGK